MRVPVRSVFVYVCVCVRARARVRACMRSCSCSCSLSFAVRRLLRAFERPISVSDTASLECRDKKMSALRQPTNKVATCQRNNGRTHTRTHTHTHQRPGRSG